MQGCWVAPTLLQVAVGSYLVALGVAVGGYLSPCYLLAMLVIYLTATLTAISLLSYCSSNAMLLLGLCNYRIANTAKIKALIKQ
tara:strand:- start:262 stop:513 length:252 start_codon:yes stop_codon:yes gene_type:complete